MERLFRVARTASMQTPLTCNCLLPTCSEHVTAPPLDDKTAENSDTSDACNFHAASYELLPAVGDQDDARHVGDCAVYTADLDADTRCCSSVHLRCSTTQDGVPLLPGVFDLASVPACFMAHLQPASDAAHFLLMASTDGSVRVADPSTLANVVAPFADIHSEMVTSCTPFISGGVTGSAAVPRLLCSAHTGAVMLYSLAERCVTHELEGHEFDAWCTAALPTSGWWTAAAPEPSSDGEEEAASGGNDGGGNNGDAGVLAGAPLLASGGDDSLLKLYDVRCGCRRATARARLGAGVVSITPVLDTSNERSGGSGAGGHTAFATPYLVVGSYDESISLFDVRAMRRPVAQRTGLGGGAWRTSRCLYPLRGRSSGEAATPPAAESATNDATLRLMLENARSSHTTGWINTSNVLVLPLMQRGAALLPYDVRAAADQVFGDAPLQHFFAEEEEEDANPLALPLLTEKSLVYDTAVLRSAATADASAVVATTSFYERRIDVWSVRPVQSV